MLVGTPFIAKSRSGMCELEPVIEARTAYACLNSPVPQSADLGMKGAVTVDCQSQAAWGHRVIADKVCA